MEDHGVPTTERLDAYRSKRRFEVTPEPAPRPASSQERAQAGKKAARELAFVVQKHDARRLHYDLRLEIEGAMASWAVPKGPSYDPAVRRLAVETEDHPMDYNAFEGRIPEGEYGAGDVLVWDRGTYQTVPPGQERAMRQKGHLHVRFAGDKLVGEWHLTRTGDAGRRVKTLDRGALDAKGDAGGGKAQWLLFKAKDARANPAFDVVAERPESVVSGRQATRGPRRAGPSEPGTSALALRTAVGGPMLATATKVIVHPKDWLFEVKYDGYRILACKAGQEVRLYTRGGHDWTTRFGPIAQGVARLGARECVVDGEVCAVDEAGRPSFLALQRWLGGGGERARIGYATFDLLWLDGRDLRGEPIEARRELLASLVEAVGAPLSFSRGVSGDVERLLESAKTAGLEGLMAKRKGSTYVAGRSPQWQKLRLVRRQECVVLGWVPMSGAPSEVGALVVAVCEGDKLVYAGRVGTGFDSRTRQELAARLDANRVEDPQAEQVPKIRAAHWSRPTLVCEVAYAEWTGDGSMRQPRYVSLREDKTPTECIAEDRAPTTPREERAPAPGLGPKLVNATKVLFPRDGVTKKDIWSYYTAAAPYLLAHLAGRPLTLQRYPDGIDGEEWYQQNAPDKTPAFVRVIDTGPRHKNKKRILCQNIETLQWLANLAALTIHQWCSHVPPGASTRVAIDRALALPDYLVLDLDPGVGPWSHLVDVARAVRTLLEALELESFVKTSGKRGVHIVVPVAAGPTHEQATAFAEQIARAVAKVLPEIATVERMKDKRAGRLYVDYGQNGEGRTIVSPYTVRARDGAVVSTPIRWEELTTKLDPTRFTIRTVLDRLAKHGDLFAGAIAGQQRMPAWACR